MRCQPMALTPILLLLAATTASGQEKSCEELCRIDPLDVPPECVCAGGAGGSGGTGSASEEMTADEVLEAERAYYAERMAGIENYWLVVESNISPMAEVRYFERIGPESPAGEMPMMPTFRLVPNSELAQRETLENPDAGDAEKLAAEDPNAFLQAYADALDVIAAETAAETGGAATGLLGALADGMREAGGDIDEQKEQDERDEQHRWPADVRSLVMSLEGPLDRRRMVRGIYHPDGSTTGERLRQRTPLRGTVRQWQEETARLQGEGKIPCAVVSFEGPYEREIGGTSYTIEDFEEWVCYPGGVGYVSTYVRIVARTVTAAGFQRVTIEKESDYFRDSGPLIPHRVRQRVSGALTEVLELVRHVQHNTGPPSQAEIAQHTFSRVGVPGARPTVDP